MLIGKGASAHEAIDVYRHEMPEIIVVDSLLPDMDSADLIRHQMTLAPADQAAYRSVHLPVRYRPHHAR